MAPWKRVGVVGKRGDREMAPLMRRVLAVLAEHSLDVVLDPEAAVHAPDAEQASLEDVAGRSDLLIVLGGDGTVLAAARAIGRRELPILGINLGRLGFLADVPPGDAEAALTDILAGQYDLYERARLSVSTGDAAEPELVLNEAVLGSEVGRLIELEACVGQQQVAHYRADGLILATPTGSTAYNLSAGGPLLDVRVPAMVLTPICPHTLTQRPLVLPDGSDVRVHVRCDENVHLTLDGRPGPHLRAGESVSVTRAAHSVRFVTRAGSDHFDTLRAKLGWGSR